MTENRHRNKLVKIGPAGWQYPDWNGTFYPKRKPAGFDALEFVTSYFSVVEINSTFYRVPRRQTCESWVYRTERVRDFSFTLKAHRGLTHSRTLPHPDEIDKFKAAVAPIYEANRMDAVLLQFPWSFRDESSSRLRLEALVTRFAPYPLAIEVRHGGWFRESGLNYLSGLSTTVCGVDQPVIGDSIKPFRHIPGPAGSYFRFHGRNYKEWFQSESNRDARYNYLYNEDELRSWMTTLRASIAAGKKTTVIMNNHFRGQAPANAFELMSFFEGGPVAAPASIRRAYPHLKAVTFLTDEDRAALPLESGSLFAPPESASENNNQ